LEDVQEGAFDGHLRLATRHWRNARGEADQPVKAVLERKPVRNTQSALRTG